MSCKESPLLFRNKSDDWVKVTLSFEYGVISVLSEDDVIVASTLTKDTTVEGPLVDGSMVSFEINSPDHVLEFADSSTKPIQEWVKFLQAELKEMGVSPRGLEAPVPSLGSLIKSASDPDKISLSSILNPASPRSSDGTDVGKLMKEAVSPRSRDSIPTPKDPPTMERSSSKDSVVKDASGSRESPSKSREGVKRSTSSNRDRKSITVLRSKDSRKVNSSSRSEFKEPVKVDLAAYIPSWFVKEIKNSNANKTISFYSNVMIEKQEDRIHVWNLHTGASLYLFSSHSSPIQNLICFGDLSRPLILSSSAKETLLWQTTTGEILNSFEAKISPVSLNEKNHWEVIVLKSETNEKEIWKFENEQKTPVITPFKE